MINVPLDLLKFRDQLKLSHLEGQTYVIDPVRKKRITFGPEELVRQLIIQYLVSEKAISRARISVEKSFKINQLLKRFDVLVYDQSLNPLLLIECKSPGIPITQNSFDQIFQYNIQFKVPLIWISNGYENYLAEVDLNSNQMKFLDGFPQI